MKIPTQITLMIALLIAFTACQVGANVSGNLLTSRRAFGNITTVDLSSVSGNATVTAAQTDSITVEIEYTYPAECYEIDYSIRSGKLNIDEDFQWNNCQGRSEWDLNVPTATGIEFSSASGSLVVYGGQGDVDVNTASGGLQMEDREGSFDIQTASGRIRITGSSGNFEIQSASGRITVEDGSGQADISAASGDIRISNSSGDFEAHAASGDIDVDTFSGQAEFSTASGDVRAAGLNLTSAASFSAASGDVSVELAASPTSDLSISSASGNSTLNYGGNDLQGYFEFTARKDYGRIIAPYPFDSEDEFTRNGYTYMRKSFTRGKDQPRVTISTSSGTAELTLK